MKIVLMSLVVVAAGTAVARADSQCAAGGAVAAEIDHNAVAAAKLPTSKVVVFDTGAWSFDETTGDGKPGRKLTGCLGKDDLAKLQAVQDAPWTITHPRAHCMTVGQTSTAFHVKGKPDYTQKTCSGDILDDKTAAALADLVKLTDAQVAAATTAKH